MLDIRRMLFFSTKILKTFLRSKYSTRYRQIKFEFNFFNSAICEIVPASDFNEIVIAYVHYLLLVEKNSNLMDIRLKTEVVRARV